VQLSLPQGCLAVGRSELQKWERLLQRWMRVQL
jgi:hypothetical protein